MMYQSAIDLESDVLGAVLRIALYKLLKVEKSVSLQGLGDYS